MAPMRSFECGKCHAKVVALATDVTHKCPAFQMKLVAFKQTGEVDEGNNKRSRNAK